jgi:hypothetical protein
LPIAYCLLPIAYCLLPIAYCLLPIAYCLLPIAYCLLLLKTSRTAGTWWFPPSERLESPSLLEWMKF